MLRHVTLSSIKVFVNTHMKLAFECECGLGKLGTSQRYHPEETSMKGNQIQYLKQLMRKTRKHN